MTNNVASSGLRTGNGVTACKPGDLNCWSKIGVSGDRSCSELSSFIHCRNCPVFAAAARTFFDRPAPEGYLAGWARWLARSGESDLAEEYRKEDKDTDEPRDDAMKVSVLIFRLGMEWLAFRTQTIAEVTTPRPVHIVPRRTNDVFLGLVNLRGQVQLCVSLHGLLNVSMISAPVRLIVLRDHTRAENWAFAVDEVLGVEHVSQSHWRSVPATLVNPTVGFSQAVLSWKERSIGLLDEERVFTALRSLEP